MKLDWDMILQNQNNNLADFLVYRHAHQGYGEHEALIYQDKIYSYGEVASLVSKAANYFTQIGIKKDDKVMLVIPDTPAFVIAFFATLACGAVAVLANPLLTVDELEYMTTHTDAKLIIADHAVIEKIQTLQRTYPQIKVLYTGDFTNKFEFENKIESMSENYQILHRNSNNLAYVLFSSGTTGKPKAIPRRHRDILHCAYSFAHDVLDMSAEDRIIAVPKLTFGYALGGGLLFGFIAGAAVILFKERTSTQLLTELLGKFKPTVFLGTPRIIAEILKNGYQDVLSSVRIATSAGESLPESVLKLWQDNISAPLLDGFGSTEVGHIFLSNKPNLIKSGTSGQCLKGFQIKIIDESGEELQDGQYGRLCIAGPSVADKYLNDKERSALAFVDGWHISNDLFLLKDGYATYIGRSDDMIKKGCGEWISPYEIENEILSHNSVLECVVIGQKSSSEAITLKAIVVCKDGVVISSALEDEIRKRVQLRWLEFPHKHIDEISFTDALPRNSSGKIQRHLLNQKTLTEYSYDC
ncbi:AMP-binding protein [Acinetobacter oleivorans]|uniref:AMP-binding protein n=1 Tax=Acinetobacter oleivorans TaxID=1148157 RepID=UPI0019021575|nr:AMP-binding protein [Acinetobacter oleivorans]MBJ9739620.1 AMP-binding protein [Acinetobacter oleivorans]MCU4411982.1 AMP-binding protein [Acinetobacter oleivorans]